MHNLPLEPDGLYQPPGPGNPEYDVFSMFIPGTIKEEEKMF